MIHTQPTIIGVLHLAQFPDDGNAAAIERVIAQAREDITWLQFGGVDAVMIENEFEGSTSPYGEFLTESQRAIMREVVRGLRPYVFKPLGFCVLLNDYRTALQLAREFDGEFVRLDTFVDTVERISDGIIIAPDPQEVIAFRHTEKLEHVELWTDVQVKHTKLLESKTLAESVSQAVAAGADKLIVTGNWTGTPPSEAEVAEVRKAAGRCGVLIGSGITAKNIAEAGTLADGCIIGTAFKRDGHVDLQQVHALTEARRLSGNTADLLVVSSFSWDHITETTTNQTRIRPGGPAHFITQALRQQPVRFDIVTSTITRVDEQLHNGDSIGSGMEVPAAIAPPARPYPAYLISTQLQEFDLRWLMHNAGTVYIDLQGYVSRSEPGQMQTLDIPRALWERLDFVKCNQRELQYLPATFLEYVKKEKVFILTRGADGVEWWEHGTHHHANLAVVRSTTSTLGAGDTFWAHFTAGHIQSNNTTTAITGAANATKIFLEHVT